VSLSLEQLRASPNALAVHYRLARVDERLPLTGHSHQAWPDVASDAVQQSAIDACVLLDEKWERAFDKADRVRAGFRARLHDPEGELALGASTHELALRFLSALELQRRPRLVTTDGEFHTLRRQLARLGEAGLEVVRVPAAPVDTLAARLAAACDDRTAAVLVSAVLFESALVVPGLDVAAAACARHGAELLVDVYHALGPVRFDIHEGGLDGAWIVGGGYKYLQLGEGNCFLRIPAHAASWRPVITGWFAEFDALTDAHDPYAVAYGRGASAFAGSTYDPASHYRAAAVLDFFAQHGLDDTFLPDVYRSQMSVLAGAFDALDLPSELIRRSDDVPLDQVGGFLSLRSPVAGELQRELARGGVLTDARGEHLRLGPAPYLSDAQLEAAVAELGAVVRARNPARPSSLWD
jgi:kynureninase